MEYWFIRVFKIDENNVDINSFGSKINRLLIFENVVYVESKEQAKSIIFEKFGNIPLRKTGKLQNGDLYAYIAKSSEYWYKYHNQEYTITCSHCGKTKKIIGSKNLYSFSNKYGNYCSKECRDEYTSLMKQIEQENNPWINNNDHLGIPKDDERNLVGYIYRITNKREHKSYIGKTIHPPLFRWWQHLKSDSKKFNRVNITDLLFEVIEIVTYDSNLECDNRYKDGEEKLAYREMFYIKHYDLTNPEYGYNKVIETSKIGNTVQLSLNLEE